MKVLLDVSAVPARPAGAGIYVMELASALAHRAQPDLDLHLITRNNDGHRWRSLGVGVHPVAPVRRPLRLAWEQAGAPRMARRLGVDLWHGPHYTMPVLLSVPAVVTIHDLTFFDRPELHERSKVMLFRKAIRMAARRAGALVCVSPPTRDRLIEILSPSVPIVLAPHGVDLARFRPLDAATARADAARLERLGVRPPFVTFVGTVEPRKNVEGLIRAVDVLGRRDLQLVVAGQPGWAEKQVAAAAARSHLGDRFRRLGYVEPDDIPALYRGAAAVAYPAFDEGFGMPVLEALACGAPVVTTTDTPMAEVAGDAAVLVPAGDDDALAGAIAAVIDGGPEVDRLRRAGPAQARPYTWEACANAHLEAYRLANG